MKLRSVSWLVGMCIVLGTGLRSYQLTARSIWFDEAFSWRLIQFPFSDMIGRAAEDVHPPLYYILLQGWTFVFGSGLLSLRSLSVVFAAASIYAAYIFAAYAFHSRYTGVLSAAFVAFSAWQISFAWEARMYTLGIFLSLVTSWVFLKAMRQRRQRVWWWLAYGVCAAASIYTHYFLLFLLLAHGVYTLGSIIAQTQWRIGEIIQLRMMWFALSSALLVGILYAPWVPALFAQHAQVQEGWWVEDVGPWSVVHTFWRMMMPTAEPLSQALLFILPFGLVLCAWMLLPLVRNEYERSGSWLVILCGALPFVGSVAFSVMGQSIYQDRFLAFAHAFILIAIAALIARIPSPRMRAGVSIVVIAGLLVSLGLYWQELDISQRSGAREASRVVFEQAKEGSPVVVSSPFIYFSILHYAHELFDVHEMPKLFSHTDRFAHFAGGPVMTREDIVGSEIFETNSVIWVIDTTGFGSEKLDVGNGWSAAYEERFREVFPHQGDIVVTRYERNL